LTWKLWFWLQQFSIDSLLTSPTPIHARTKRRAGSPIRAAIGVAMVAIDHHMTPKPSTCFPPMLSAHMPPAICNQNFWIHVQFHSLSTSYKRHTIQMWKLKEVHSDYQFLTKLSSTCSWKRLRCLGRIIRVQFVVGVGEIVLAYPYSKNAALHVGSL
jgi:hypothetical protein